MPKTRLPYAVFGLTHKSEALPGPRQFATPGEARAHLDNHRDAIAPGGEGAYFAEVRKLPDGHDSIEDYAEAGGTGARLIHRWLHPDTPQEKKRGGAVKKDKGRGRRAK